LLVNHLLGGPTILLNSDSDLITSSNRASAVTVVLAST
jgi:hypothetical protein